jgi:hypothetical protein
MPTPANEGLTEYQIIAENTANAVAAIGDAAWEDAKTCRTFMDAACVYSSRLVEALYSLQWKLNHQDNGKPKP